MVRLLMRMKIAQLHHARGGRGRWAGLFGLLVGIASIVGTLLLGIATYPTTAIGTDVLSLVFTLWVSGQVGFATFGGGDVTLRPEIFRLIPVPRRQLARGLLLTGFLDPSLLFVAGALSALVILGARHGWLAGLVAVVGVLGTVVLTGVLVTVVGGLVAAPNRRRRGVATVVLGVLISLVAVAGPLTPTLVSDIRTGRATGLTAVVRVLPTGWAGDAVRETEEGRLTGLLPLLALVLLTAALVAGWPAVLGRRLVGAGHTSGRHRAQHHRAAVFHGATGAVVAKELRQWSRDPVRSTTLLIAAIVGLGVCLMPYLTNGTRVLLPFAGLLTVVIAGAVAGNLIGADGLALKISIITPRSARPDGLGRQLAWLLIVGPYAVVATVVLTAAGSQGWAWPWVLSALPAWLGGAAGLIPLAAVVAVRPLDERGGLTPGWPVKIYACLGLIVLTGVPALAMPLFGTVLDLPWLEWLGPAVGCLTGVALAVWLGRLAARRFSERQLDILETLTEAASPA